jgi:hypothetical protein
MHPQITKLWNKAASETALLSSEPNSWETQKAFVHKFAELIIRDCAKIADIAEPWNSSDLILNYFGIEHESGN